MIHWSKLQTKPYTSLFSRLRTHLIILILLMLIPILMVKLYATQEQTNSVIRLMHQQAIQLSHVIATTQQQQEAHARHLLTTLAALPAIQQLAHPCNPTFNALLNQYEGDVNHLFLADINGEILCTSATTPVYDVSRQGWFLSALATRAFTVGSYQARPNMPYATLIYALPIFDDAGDQLRYILGIELDLAGMHAAVATLSLLPDTRITAIDRAGSTLFDYPSDDASSTIGAPYTALPLDLFYQPADDIADSLPISDTDPPLIYGFTPFTEAQQIAVIVRLPEAVAKAEITQLQRQDVILLFVIGMIIFSIIWYGVDLLFVRPIEGLVESARRLANGELSTRANLNQLRHTHELYTLAHTFNEMADSLETRQSALKRDRDHSEMRVQLRTKELAFLVKISNILASSLDYETTLNQVAEQIIQQIAHWCVIHVKEGDTFRQVALAHQDPQKRERGAALMRQYPLYDPASPDSPLPIQRLYNDVSIFFRHIAKNEEHYQALSAFEVNAVMQLPLILRGSVIGMITLATEKTNTHHDESTTPTLGYDLLSQSSLAQELVAQTSMAIENARLYAEMEDRVKERTQQLTAVNKELEAFSYSVSHDLRTPLRAINGFSQALIEDYSHVLDEEGLTHLQRVRNATQLMGTLINDLLQLSRVTRTDMEQTHVNLSLLAEEIILHLRQSEPKRRVDVQIQPNLIAYVDRNLVYSLLQNLLSNAWKFSSKQEVAKIEFGITKYDDILEVYFIRDNGAGFDMDYADKLFGAFQRLHATNEFEGTGIGLATVQRIVHRHKGQIWAYSQLNHGATFYFTFNKVIPDVEKAYSLS